MKISNLVNWMFVVIVCASVTTVTYKAIADEGPAFCANKKCGTSEACVNQAPPSCASKTTSSSCNSTAATTSTGPNQTVLRCTSGTKSCANGADTNGSQKCVEASNFCVWENGACVATADEGGIDYDCKEQ